MRSFTKLYEVRRNFSSETSVKSKMLNFVLPTENRLVVSFWTFFKYLGNHSELEKSETTKNFC